MIDGQTYYNIRATEPGSAFVRLTASGPETPPPDEIDWFETPAHAGREYWIARAEISGDGLLRLGFIAVNARPDAEEVGAALVPYLSIHGQGDSYRTETCGEFCAYARADLGPDTLTEILRRFPADQVFALGAGPFARLEAALPRFEYTVFGSEN